MTDERFRNSAVDSVHGHVVAVVGCPAECQFGKVSRADDQAARLVGDVHQDLGAFASLRIFVRDTPVAGVQSDV